MGPGECVLQNMVSVFRLAVGFALHASAVLQREDAALLPAAKVISGKDISAAVRAELKATVSARAHNYYFSKQVQKTASFWL